MGLLAQMATETGATVMVNHHMAKIRTKILLQRQKRLVILFRVHQLLLMGSGQRCCWQVDEGVARTRCKNLRGHLYKKRCI